MSKFIKKTAKTMSAFILAAALLTGTALTSVYATGAEPEQETTPEETAPVVPVSVYPDVDADELTPAEVIDLSIHSETTGDFTGVYNYKNPFQGKDTSKGIILEFYAKPTWEVHVLGAIVAFTGTGDYDGRLYFTPGSYLGYNSGGFGGYFDANLYNYTIVKDYIRDGAEIKIEIVPDGFAVYSNGELCYDQTILNDAERAAYSYETPDDYTKVLEWIAGAENMFFGYGSWWNASSSNEANILLSKVKFSLADGTVVMDGIKADKQLVEAAGGSLEALPEAADQITEFEDVDVEIFDIDSVEYEGTSVLPIMAAIVVTVLIGAIVIVVVITKEKTYSDI